MQGDPQQLEPEDDEFFDSHENAGFSTLMIFYYLPAPLLW